MPAVSKSQQRLMGWVYACKTGKSKNCPKNIKKVAKGISTKDVKKFAKTKHKGLKEMETQTLIQFLQEVGEEDSMWAMGGDVPKDRQQTDRPPEQRTNTIINRDAPTENITPQIGNIIQTANSNYIVLGINDTDIKVREIDTNTVGTVSNKFKYEEKGKTQAGRLILQVVSK